MKKLLTLLALSYVVPALAQDELPSINNSSIAFTIPEKDLLPESIAYDPQQQAFYVSSTRKGKVVKVDNEGNVSDFVMSKKHDLWMTIGMKIDAQRRVLWVCSSGGDNLIEYQLKDETDGRPAGVFKFDLDNGELLQKFTFEGRGEVHFLNDLAINMQNGEVYFTHMFGDHSIYKIPWNSEPEIFLASNEIPYPNGITIKGTQTLFVAHDNGVSCIDIESKKMTLLSVPEDQNISKQASIDGLYYYREQLIGIHPGTSTVSSLALNTEGTGFDRVEILEQNHPMMRNPTTGVVVGNDLYYIANAQFGSFNEDGSLWEMEKLYEPVILKVKIDE